MRYISEVISLLHLGKVDNLYKKKPLIPLKQVSLISQLNLVIL